MRGRSSETHEHLKGPIAHAGCLDCSEFLGSVLALVENSLRASCGAGGPASHGRVSGVSERSIQTSSNPLPPTEPCIEFPSQTEGGSCAGPEKGKLANTAVHCSLWGRDITCPLGETDGERAHLPQCRNKAQAMLLLFCSILKCVEALLGRSG